MSMGLPAGTPVTASMLVNIPRLVTATPRTEDVSTICAESFRGAAHLRRIQAEARRRIAMVCAAV